MSSGLNQKAGTIVHTFSSSFQKAEAGSSLLILGQLTLQVPDQMGLHVETLLGNNNDYNTIIIEKIGPNIFGFVFWDRTSCGPGWPQTHHIAMKHFELLILLSLPHKHCYYRHVPWCLVYMHLEIEPRALCVLGKHSTNWATSPTRAKQSLSRVASSLLYSFQQINKSQKMIETHVFTL